MVGINNRSMDMSKYYENIPGSEYMSEAEKSYFEHIGDAIDDQAKLTAEQFDIDAEEMEEEYNFLMNNLADNDESYLVHGALLKCSRMYTDEDGQILQNKQILEYNGAEIHSEPDVDSITKMSKLQVTSETRAEFGEFTPATVKDAMGGLRDENHGLNIVSFGNCPYMEETDLKAIIQELSANAPEAEVERQVLSAITNGKGSCYCCMKLNSEWENLPVDYNFETKSFEVNISSILKSSTAGVNRMLSSPYMIFNGEQGINMMSILFCQRGGIIMPVTSGQIKHTYEEIIDQVTANRIQKLHPAIRLQVINFIVEVQEIYPDIRIANGYRSIEEQNEIYNKGRNGSEGAIVTNAKGGSSYHNYGLAIDIVRIVDNEINYDINWDEIVAIGDKYGFEWGGNWTSIVDKPHFQITFGYEIKELRSLYEGGKVKDGYVILD